MAVDAEETEIPENTLIYYQNHFRLHTFIHGFVAVCFTVLGFLCVAKHDGRSNPPYFLGTFFVAILLFVLTVFCTLIYKNVIWISNDEDKRDDVRKWVYYNNALSISLIMVYILCIIIAAVKGIPYGQKDDDHRYLDYDYYDVVEEDQVDPVAETNKKLAFAIVFSSLAGFAVHLYSVIFSCKTASAFKVNLRKRRGLTGFVPNRMGNIGTSAEEELVTGDRVDNTLMNDTPEIPVPPRLRPYEPIPLEVGPRAPPSAPPPSYEEVMQKT